MRLLRHQRRFVEARKNELELARIPIDVADCENARNIGFEARSLDRDKLIVVQGIPQFATGPSFIVRPKNGNSASHAISNVEPSFLLTIALLT